ncbi:MAG: alpha/beta hydrolase-fold protein [Candidatus Krumholzibacteriia bacterium]
MKIDLTPPPWATHLVSDLDDWLRAPRPVADVAPFEVPDDAYFEYAWLDRDGTPRPDPDNPNPPRNEWWPYARYLAGPAYVPDPWAEVPAKTAPAGVVRRLRLDSRHLQEQRHVLVYTPAGQAGRPLPQVVFQDGKAYYGWGRTPQIFDRLLQAGRCEPAHLVFIPPVRRSVEYHLNDRYLAFVHEEVLPAVEERAPCLHGRRVAWGASMGGFCSAELAWRHPLSFQTVVSQSGAFLFHPGQRIGDDPHGGRPWWRERVGREAWRPVRWHLQTGTLEWLHEPNRNLARALEIAGYDVRYAERPSGHNWTTWRNGLAEGFRFALPVGA